MALTLLLQILGSVAVVFCGAVFLLSASSFFLDRSPARKESQQSMRSDKANEDREGPRAA